MSVLTSVYPLDQIHIVEHHFNDDHRSVRVICLVPRTGYYTMKPIPYVTAENHVRCLSQASYVLAERLIEQRLIPVEISAETFRQAAADYALYYRNLGMTFHQLVPRGQPFPMVLHLQNWKEIRRLEDFVLFTFASEKAAISGEMSFVFRG